MYEAKEAEITDEHLFRRMPLSYPVQIDTGLNPANFFSEEKNRRILDAGVFARTCGSIYHGRQLLTNILWEVYNKPLNMFAEYHVNPVDLEQWGSVLELLLTSTGMADVATLNTMKPGETSDGDRLYSAYKPRKYMTYNELQAAASEWKERGFRVGLVQGSFDPVHIGHGNCFANVFPFCDVLLVGFVKDSHLREAKGGDHPRFPLAWRIAETTLFPCVDHVFVPPVESYYDDEGYEKMWRELGVSVIGYGAENKFSQIYRERLYKVAGESGIAVPIPKVNWSSTLMMEANTSPSFVGGAPSLTMGEQSKFVASEAIRHGILRDYPNGT